MIQTFDDGLGGEYSKRFPFIFFEVINFGSLVRSEQNWWPLSNAFGLVGNFVILELRYQCKTI